MTTTTLVQLIIQIITLLLVLGVILFKSYFQEKGKNIATKEDIKEITEKIETVKAEIKRQENIKTNLFELKRKACLNALNIANSVLSNYKYSEVGEGDITPQYTKTEDVRACFNELACTCEKGEVLDILKKIISGSVTPDIIVDLRNAVRKELNFSEKEIDTDRTSAFVGKINCDPHTSNDLV